MRHWLKIAAAVAALALVTGCEGDKPPPTTDTTTTTVAPDAGMDELKSAVNAANQKSDQALAAANDAAERAGRAAAAAERAAAAAERAAAEAKAASERARRMEPATVRK